MLGIPWRAPIYDYLRDQTGNGAKVSAASLKKAWEFCHSGRSVTRSSKARSCASFG